MNQDRVSLRIVYDGYISIGRFFFHDLQNIVDLLK